MNHSQSSSRLPPLYPNQPQDPTPLFHSLLLPPLFRTSPSLDLPPKPTKAPWTIAEDKLLKKLMANRLDSWEKIANGFEGRSVHCLKQRWTVLSSLAQDTQPVIVAPQPVVVSHRPVVVTPRPVAVIPSDFQSSHQPSTSSATSRGVQDSDPTWPNAPTWTTDEEKKLRVLIKPGILTVEGVARFFPDKPLSSVKSKVGHMRARMRSETPKGYNQFANTKQRDAFLYSSQGSFTVMSSSLLAASQQTQQTHTQTRSPILGTRKPVLSHRSWKRNSTPSDGSASPPPTSESSDDDWSPRNQTKRTSLRIAQQKSAARNLRRSARTRSSSTVVDERHVQYRREDAQGGAGEKRAVPKSESSSEDESKSSSEDEDEEDEMDELGGSETVDETEDRVTRPGEENHSSTPIVEMDSESETLSTLSPSPSSSGEILNAQSSLKSLVEEELSLFGAQVAEERIDVVEDGIKAEKKRIVVEDERIAVQEESVSGEEGSLGSDEEPLASVEEGSISSDEELLANSKRRFPLAEEAEADGEEKNQQPPPPTKRIRLAIAHPESDPLPVLDNPGTKTLPPLLPPSNFPSAVNNSNKISPVEVASPDTERFEGIGAFLANVLEGSSKWLWRN